MSALGDPVVGFVPAVKERLTSAALGLIPADAGWPVADRELALMVHGLVNAHRQSLGLQPVVRIGSLTAAAEWKARHMAQYAYMAHDDPAPPVARPWYERLADNGYASSFAAENIAFGYPTPASVMQGWLQSPPHKVNLETPAWTATGIGAARASNGTVYWAECFGVGSDPTPPPPPPPPPTPTSGHQLDMWVSQTLTWLPGTTQTYKAWRRTNKAEAKAFDAWLANPTGAPPKLASPWGRFLIGTATAINKTT